MSLFRAFCERAAWLAVCVLIGSCGETRTLRLSYELADNALQEPPNLSLIVAQNQSGSLNPNFRLDDLPGTFREGILRQRLQGCALDQGEVSSSEFPDASLVDACQELGAEIGQELFASQAVEPALRAEVEVTAETAYLFVLFIYAADELAAGGERCVMLKTLRVTDSLISADGSSPSKSLLLSLENRVSSLGGSQNQNCYPLL